jgi:hypothetical protein
MAYFKPLRRKIGVLMLMMACAFMVGWVRSRNSEQTLSLPISSDAKCYLQSAWSEIRLYKTDEITIDDERFLRISKGGWSIVDAVGHEDSATYLSTANAIVHTDLVTVPYWSVVIPLTLLSAWLLLSTPRVKKAPETQAPTE